MAGSGAAPGGAGASTGYHATNGLEPPRPRRLLRVAEVIRRTGLSRSTLWPLERQGAFPAKRRLTGHLVGWLAHEVDAWIDSRATRSGGCR